MGVRSSDTAPLYSEGISEEKCGKVFSGITRSSVTISGKVGPSLEAPDPTPVDSFVFFLGNTELSMELYRVIAWISGFDD